MAVAIRENNAQVVIGLGNPILSDDGVGIFVARRVKEELTSRRLPVPVDVVEASLAGFNLLDLLLGYQRAIIVDSIKTKGGTVGDIYQFSPEALAQTVRLASVHDLNLATALKFGKMMDMPLPGDITIYAVEVNDNTTFHEGCCPEVERVIPRLAEMVLAALPN